MSDNELKMNKLSQDASKYLENSSTASSKVSVNRSLTLQGSQVLKRSETGGS
jgi:hypothetical protein